MALSARTLRALVLTGCVAPALALGLRLALGRLGVNPIAELLNALGYWALVFLLASLACTPVKLVTGWLWPVRIRKILGLAAFYFALVHFLFYVIVDQGFDLEVLWDDLRLRKFILVGMLALLVMVPLALTSRAKAVRRLGPVRWRRLHRLAYVAGVFAVVHFIWRVKSDTREPMVFAVILVTSFAVRIVSKALRGASGSQGS